MTCLADQPNVTVTAAPDNRRRQLVQLSPRELDIYANQLARCLKALGTNAPIRPDIQRELITVRAEQDARANAPTRSPNVSGMTSNELHRSRRELQASMALATPGSAADQRSTGRLEADLG